ncbi:MAG TPA: VanZ family protein [Chitinophagaceae bacterium]|nr:VanZ family protein [Chitinophagaceae bacterium]
MLRTAGVLYFSLLFYIFFLARRRPRPSFNRHIFPHNFIPLKHKFEDAALYHTMHDIEKWNFITDLVGNIVLFIPLPFFLSLIFNIKSTARLVLVCFLISLVVEVTQYVAGIGVADVDDIIFNTLGACMGAVLVKVWLAMQLRWRKPA